MTTRLLAAAIAALAIASPARAAGTYQQQLCPSSITPLRAFGAGVWIDCRPGMPGVYGNTPAQPEDGWHAVHADAPPGARYTALAIDLQVPWQAFNRNTWVAEEVGYAWQDHNAWGGGFTFNPEGNTFGIPLHQSAWLEVGQSCHGSRGSCEAGDWTFHSATATLYDATPPVVAPADTGLFAHDRGLFRGLVAVTADVVDAGKGPQSARVLVDGAVAGADAWPDATCDFRLPTPCANRLGWTRALDTSAFADGVHSVRVSADDGLGNAGAAERAVTFDNTAPELVAGGAIEGRTVTARAAAVPVAASDATSGVARIEAAEDADAAPGVTSGVRRADALAAAPTWQRVTDAVAVTGAGLHRVRMRAVDRAGNVSAERLVSFTLAPVPANQRVVRRDGALECDPGAPWSAETTFTYVWLRDGVEVATGRWFVPGPQDTGRSVACRAIAGNEAGETRVESPAIVIDSPAPAAAPRGGDAAPASAPAPAAARIEGDRMLTLRWGQRRAIAGVLVREDGSPVAGGTLAVTARVLTPGALPRELPPVRTDAAGRFSVAVADGPSRTFSFRHGALEREVVVRVIPRVTVAARRGVVTGQVLGATARWPNTVALQALRRGGWATVKTVRIRAGGRFRARISAHRLRALVRAAPGWPFEAGRSREISA